MTSLPQCDYDDPLSVVRAYVLAMHHWGDELQKEARADAGSNKQDHDHRLDAIFKAYCTARKRTFVGPQRFQHPPDYDPEKQEFRLKTVGGRKAFVDNLRNDGGYYRYVLVRQEEQWRIDHLKYRPRAFQFSLRWLIAVTCILGSVIGLSAKYMVQSAESAKAKRASENITAAGVECRSAIGKLIEVLRPQYDSQGRVFRVGNRWSRFREHETPAYWELYSWCYWEKVGEGAPKKTLLDIYVRASTAGEPKARVEVVRTRESEGLIRRLCSILEFHNLDVEVIEIDCSPRREQTRNW